jgi:hypothetical protein
MLSAQQTALRIRSEQAAAWTPDQLDRKAQAEAGRCVVANMHKQIDGALLAWARAADRLVRIDGRSKWRNPFQELKDGDRATVVDKFTRFYLPHKRGLMARVPTLRGKVLGCWCHPEQCHGHVIARLVNEHCRVEAAVAAAVHRHL